MEKTTVICDGCLNEIRDSQSFKQKNSDNMIDICSICIRCVVQNYLDSRGTRPLMSECDCDKGRVLVKDDDATFASASCGENRTQHKWVDCKKCVF